jgi:hypothetical protein
VPQPDLPRLQSGVERKTLVDELRREDGGRGFDGVVERAPDYANPFLEGSGASSGLVYGKADVSA